MISFEGEVLLFNNVVSMDRNEWVLFCVDVIGWVVSKVEFSMTELDCVVVVVESEVVDIVDDSFVIEISASISRYIVDVSDKNWIDGVDVVWKISNWNGSKSSLYRSSNWSGCWNGEGVSSAFG